jgi:hypothetical protein
MGKLRLIKKIGTNWNYLRGDIEGECGDKGYIRLIRSYGKLIYNDHSNNGSYGKP